MADGEHNQIHAMLQADILDMRKSIREDFDLYRKDIKELNDNFSAQVKELKVIIMPMVDSYSTALRIGKWTSRTLIFISVVIGIILSLFEVFKNLANRIR